MADRVQRAHAPAQPRHDAGADAQAERLTARSREATRFLLRHRVRAPLEWDLRLESPDGAADWRLPAGIPWTQGEAREARPEPVGEAPAGDAWDRGRASVVLAAEDELVLQLDGRRVRGRYALRREGPPGSAWRVERLDPVTVRPMPDRVLPMLARAAEYPQDAGEWAFEMKWDGVRALAHVRDGRVLLRSRNLLNMTPTYPELQGLADALEGREALLDGEVVAIDADGRPSFQRLQGRLRATDKATIRRKMQEVPVVYVAFDVLHLDGHDTTGLPYEERRALLEGLRLSGPHWQVPPVVIGDGRALLRIPGAEGVVAKRLGSTYEPGARSAAWIKVKEQRRQELVIGGYTAGRGARKGGIGSLMMGYHDAEGKLRYAGNVGTGFDDATLRDLEARLRGSERAQSPFADPVDKEGTFVEPRLVAEIEFTEWTRGGRLRHPSFKGLRFDKDPREVAREEE